MAKDEMAGTAYTDEEKFKKLTSPEREMMGTEDSMPNSCQMSAIGYNIRSQQKKGEAGSGIDSGMNSVMTKVPVQIEWEK